MSNRVPFDLGWYQIEFTQDVTFKAAGPTTGDYKATKGRRANTEIIEDKGDSVVVQWSNASCSTLKKAWFRRLRPVRI